MLHYFQADLLDVRQQETQLKPARARAVEALNEELEQHDEDDEAAADAAESAARAVTARKKGFSKRKAVYMAPLKSVQQGSRQQ